MDFKAVTRFICWEGDILELGISNSSYVFGGNVPDVNFATRLGVVCSCTTWQSLNETFKRVFLKYSRRIFIFRYISLLFSNFVVYRCVTIRLGCTCWKGRALWRFVVWRGLTTPHQLFGIESCPSRSPTPQPKAGASEDTTLHRQLSCHAYSPELVYKVQSAALWATSDFGSD